MAGGGGGAVETGRSGVVGRGDRAEMSEVRASVDLRGRSFATTRRRGAGRGCTATGAVTLITVMSFGARSTIAGWPASGTEFEMMSFGKATALAPPATASATVSARKHISLMELPLPAEKHLQELIGSDLGN